MRKQMEKYYGKPSEVGKNIKKAAKKVVSDAKNSPQAKAVAKAVKSPSVQTAAGLLIPGGAALKAPKIAKGLKTAGKAVAKAVGIGKASKATQAAKPTSTRMPETDAERYLREYGKPLRPLTKEEKEMRRRAMERANISPEKGRQQRQEELNQSMKDYARKVQKQKEDEEYRRWSEGVRATSEMIEQNNRGKSTYRPKY